MNSYSANFDPPALCLDVTVGNGLSRRKRRTLYALLDTGADITAIPGECVDLLGLYKIDRLRLETVEGTASIIYTYAVRFTLGDLVIPRLEVILTGLDIVLVGRDVLNQLYLQLDGPQQQFAFQTTPFHT
jgi:hypothetical protein